jgi:AraC-like DNA-binding protein
MRTLYFPVEMTAGLPGECCAIEVTPLLRELVLEAVELCPIDDGDAAAMRLVEVAIDCIAAAPALPLQLPFPSDPRALRLAERLREDPSCELELADLARDAGASGRTIQRLFLAQTGLRFAEWRQRLRLMHGASVLGAGSSVTDAGLEACYSSTSAFIAAFRKQFGTTPTGR